MSEHPTTKVARDLSAITDMAAALVEQAENDANSSLMPGGKAMVSLAHVANLEAWENRYEAAERHARPAGHVEDEDDSWEPPLQTLCFWSEQWRAEHAAEYDRRPTLASEAAFIRWALDWAWKSELHWEDFARDIGKARRRLEDVLKEGERAERGVPCLYEECGGVRLVRKLKPTRGADGEKTWVLSDWHCPKCKRSWDDDRYARMVTAAHERTKFEDIDGETWCSDDYAARQIGRSVKTIRTWINRGLVSTACLIAGRRVRYVNLREVRERHAESGRRKRAA